LKKTAIIVAGGSGTRMGTEIPKQFLLLGGKPVLMHSMGAFERAFPGIGQIVVLPAGLFDEWRNLCKIHGFTLSHRLAEGGETRFHSVKNALATTSDEGLIAIHDAARPLVGETLIRKAFDHAERFGNAIPAVTLSESVRLLSENGSRAVNRHDYRTVQTPQVFRSETIRRAYRQEYRDTFTDCASVAESAGISIHLIDGDPVNLKITFPHEIALAEALLPFQR